MPFKSVLLENTPDSLQDLCLQACVENHQSWGKFCKFTSLFLGVNDGLSLPTELCEKLLQYQMQEDRDLDTYFVTIFGNTICTRLKQISLKLCTLKDHEADILFKHELKVLELIRMKVTLFHTHTRMISDKVLFIGDSKCSENTEWLLSAVDISYNIRMHWLFPNPWAQWTSHLSSKVAETGSPFSSCRERSATVLLSLQRVPQLDLPWSIRL